MKFLIKLCISKRYVLNEKLLVNKTWGIRLIKLLINKRLIKFINGKISNFDADANKLTLLKSLMNNLKICKRIHRFYLCHIFNLGNDKYSISSMPLFLRSCTIFLS